jgi:esterase/lipase superfamily enzyme
LIDACAQFPDLPPEQQEEEKHLALCIHGYNNGFASSIDFYTRVYNGLFAGADGLGICVLFTWPSKGEVYRVLTTSSRYAVNGILQSIFSVAARRERLCQASGGGSPRRCAKNGLD